MVASTRSRPVGVISNSLNHGCGRGMGTTRRIRRVVVRARPQTGRGGRRRRRLAWAPRPAQTRALSGEAPARWPGWPPWRLGQCRRRCAGSLADAPAACARACSCHPPSRAFALRQLVRLGLVVSGQSSRLTTRRTIATAMGRPPVVRPTARRILRQGDDVIHGAGAGRDRLLTDPTVTPAGGRTIGGRTIGAALRVGIPSGLVLALAFAAARAGYGRRQTVQAGNGNRIAHHLNGSTGPGPITPIKTPTFFFGGVAAAASARLIAIQPSMKFSGSLFRESTPAWSCAAWRRARANARCGRRRARFACAGAGRR